jgi:hypothetical protein
MCSAFRDTFSIFRRPRSFPSRFNSHTRRCLRRVQNRIGLGALNFAIGSDDYLSEKVREYRLSIAQAKPNGRVPNNSFSCTPVTLVLNNDRKACRYGFRGARFFADMVTTYYLSGTRPTGPLDIERDFFSDDELEQAMASRNMPGSAVAVIVGDPVYACETV